MADEGSLEDLQDLHRDLQALSESRLVVVERLWNQLQARVEDFRKLLDQKKRDDQSRQLLSIGKITVDGEEYTINEDFRDQTLQLANTLDLNEIESAKLFLLATREATELDREPLTGALIRFQQRRQFLLECVRLIIKLSQEEDIDQSLEDAFGAIKATKIAILETQDGSIEKIAQFWKRCLSSMSDIEKRLQDLTDRFIRLTMTDRNPSAEIEEAMKFEKASLTRQHESLAEMCCLLVKEGAWGVDNYHAVQEAVKRYDKHDAISIHYVPLLSILIGTLGPTYSTACSLREARSLHKTIVSALDTGIWAQRDFQAAVTVWWLSEYSGRYVEQPTGSPLQGVDLEAEAAERSKVFMTAIKDGALHYMLSICQDMRPDRWYDPARAGLISFLLKDTTTLPADSVPFSESFQDLVMEQLQGFADAFISNMPDTLRKLKTEEDDQRKKLGSLLAAGQGENELHLERFLIIICFAYDGFPDAALSFWSEPDGNLYGFLQWAARRQTTPRVAAFCEMLRALAVGEECAEAAHRFLQEESSQISARSRRHPTLSYSQIFSALQIFRDNIIGTQGTNQAANQNLADRIAEPESAMMLESYLRLLAHLCTESTAARESILQNANIVPLLLSLCQSNVESRLRASVFTALTSLLTGKTAAIGYSMWTFLDTWLHTGFNSTSKQGIPPALYEEYVWNAIASGYEESNAFIELLRVLTTASQDDSGLNDALAFPENLGSAHRMPGIDIYIDFVVGRLFVEKHSGFQPLQLRVMRWNCLKFISTCLGSFNEDLVILANTSGSSIDVDSAIQTSSLAAYVQLHPFARVMEWLFNDKVITALFDTAHQDIEEVNDAAPDSPLVLSLFSSIEVMNQIMNLQSTYLGIVRPLIKMNSTSRKPPVSNVAIASFEDAVYTNLHLIVDLGLYCGIGHEDLTIASLRLLERLSTSKKLSGTTDGFSQRSSQSKIIGVMEKDNEAERIAKGLISKMEVDEREVQAGPESTGYTIKTTILSFLNGCLSVTASRPNIAHLLLGFSVEGDSLDVGDDGLMAHGSSLLHSIVQIATYYPDDEGGNLRSWLTGIKRSCFEILQRLWRSPLSSSATMAVLRNDQLLFNIMLRLQVVTPDTIWEGQSLYDTTFFLEDSALAFQNYLSTRLAIYDYMGRELRAVARESNSTVKAKVQSAIIGTTVFPNGESVKNASIFDLFDFMELLTERPQFDQDVGSMAGLNSDLIKPDQTGRYNINEAVQKITLRRNALRSEGKLMSLDDENRLQEEGQIILGRLHASNQERSTTVVQKEILKTWVQAVTIILEDGDFDGAGRTNFILQTLQLIIPKIENSYHDDYAVALELLRLSKTLLHHVNFTSSSFQDNTTGEFANDRMFQLFKTALAGIYSAVSEPQLRETCYQICYRYQLGVSRKNKQIRRYIIQAIESAGDYYLEVLCEDAYAGQGTCRVSALLFLEALVSLSVQERSKHILERLVRFNFVALCVDSIKIMPTDLRSASASDVTVLLSYYEAVLSLLLRVCQTRDGAVHVLNSGLFQSIRESGIFAADPDIGLEIDNPNSLAKYFDLMLSVLRVINAAVLSRGPQNQHTISAATEFLKENRPSMVAVFKRNANIGGVLLEKGIDLNDLVDNYTLLITATNFLKFEDQQTEQKPTVGMYS